MASTGGAASRLTTGLGVCEAPSWSPDSELIAFGSTISGAARVWTIAPSGSGSTMISDDLGVDTTPGWS
ncbi:hypothetical protein BH18ACT17_BH18ACT17_14590 [soil metagenome]